MTKRLTPETRAERRMIAVVVGFITFLLLLIACGACTSTKYVPVETVRTDTLTATRYMEREVFVHDSVSVYVNGDTVRETRWRDRWRTVTRTDTVCKVKTEYVDRPYPVEVVKEVERKRAWWETALMGFGGFSAFALLALGAVAVKTKRHS